MPGSAQVINHLKGRLCVCNAYSGSRVSGDRFPAANCMERIMALAQGEMRPDIILVYIGFNDFGYGVCLKGNEPEKEDICCFYDAYLRMLLEIRECYPETMTVCGTLMKGYLKKDSEWIFPECFGGYPFSEYNALIREAVRKSGCSLADLASLGTRYETLDGTHATAVGQKTISEA